MHKTIKKFGLGLTVSNKKLRLTAITIFAGLLILLGLTSYAAPAGITQGLAWLQTQIISTGVLSTASKVATVSQAQCETANTLLQLAGNNSQIASLLTALEANPSEDQATESLACAQSMRQKLGQLTANSALDARKITGAGYGAYSGFTAANALDTGWALQAHIKNLSLTDKAQILAWLQAQQKTDGSFAVSDSAGLSKANLLSTENENK